MRTIVITPPAPIVTWAEADQHLRLDSDTEQRVFVESLILAASGHIDGPNGWLGRAIGEQTLETAVDSFGHLLRLPYPPLIEVTEIRYLDSSRAEQIIDPSQYEVVGGYLVPAVGHHWPSAYAGKGIPAIAVQYRAGYQSIPAPIKAAVLLMVGDLWHHRQSAVTGDSNAVPMSATVENLLSPYRVYA